MERVNKGFTLVEVIIVMAIIGILVAVTVTLFKPQEILANSRNAKRVDDVKALNQAIGQWLASEGLQYSDAYTTLGVLGPEITALTPGDGSIRDPDEGVEATTIIAANLSAYIANPPTDPVGDIEYRVGVDDVTNPLHVLVCTDQIEITSSYVEADYPSSIFCQSN
jgi:prepilin-type N-terminal cleavage/methylation domain-containing protein